MSWISTKALPFSLPRTILVIAAAVGARIAEPQVDPAVLGVVGMDGDVEQAALALVEHGGDAGDRLGGELALLDDPQLAASSR